MTAHARPDPHPAPAARATPGLAARLAARPAARLTVVWPLIVALIVTLGLKMAIIHQGFATDQLAVTTERRHVTGWLHTQGFAVEPPVDDSIMITDASRGSCRMRMVAIDPRGFHRDIMDRMRAPGTDLFFAFDGALYPRQPLVRGMIAHHLWARARDIGIRLPRRLMIGVIATGCDRNALDWRDLGRLP